MIDATSLFYSQIYKPAKLLAFYTAGDRSYSTAYVESFDICPRRRKPINPHVLTVAESRQLARLMAQDPHVGSGFLKSKGILPENVLHISPGADGYGVWYTPAAAASMLFDPQLGIPNGTAQVPSLLWKASKEQLQIFAFAGSGRPTIKTALYHAPFFNIYQDGQVCMGTADCQMPAYQRLEEFITRWQQLFWGSYFSHAIAGYQQVQGTLVALWQQQIENGGPFPVERLVKANITLQNLLQ